MRATTIIFILILVLLFAMLGIKLYQESGSPKIDPSVTSNLDGFAQCLAEKEITMYGAEWCSHCKAEKKAFGSSFQYVPYVECPDNIQFCLDKGIEGYPTWITKDGEKLVGEQGLEKLAEVTGCPLQ